jgi:DNA-binding transcriptional ArsR family regulator
MRNTKESVKAPEYQTIHRRTANVGSDAEAASNLLKLASDPVRLTILLSLMEGESGISELAELLEQGLPSLIQHFAILSSAGLIAYHRHGSQRLYALTTQGRGITEVVRTLLRDEPSTVPVASPSVPIEQKLLEDVKGFVDDPEEWFRTPNAAFEGRQPIELLGTADEPRLRNRIEAAKLGMFS